MSAVEKNIVLVFVLASSLFAVPPYFWYATHSINSYRHNGACGFYDPYRCHADADAFSLAIQNRPIVNKWRRYHRKDSACTAARWNGFIAETNGVDFLFYAGHGTSKGPFLGCNPGYQITCWESIRFGGSGHLKWVQAGSCLWFVSKDKDSQNTGKDEFERWQPCFKGLHTLQAHAAVTYEMPFNNQLHEEFFSLWVDQGFSIAHGWAESQIKWVYYNGSWAKGLIPATGGPTADYVYETWAQATDDPAPHQFWVLTCTYVGTPRY